MIPQLVRCRTAVVLAVFAVLLGSCSGDRDESVSAQTPEMPVEEAASRALDGIRAQNDESSVWRPPPDLDRLIGAVADGDADQRFPAARLVVSGRFTEVETGFGYLHNPDFDGFGGSGESGPELFEVDFEDEAAEFVTAFATFIIEDTIAGESPSRELVFEFPVSRETLHGLERLLVDLGNVVVVATHDPNWPISSKADFVVEGGRSFVFQSSEDGWVAPLAPIRDGHATGTDGRHNEGSHPQEPIQSERLRPYE